MENEWKHKTLDVQFHVRQTIFEWILIWQVICDSEKKKKEQMKNILRTEIHRNMENFHFANGQSGIITPTECEIKAVIFPGRNHFEE